MLLARLSSPQRSTSVPGLALVIVLSLTGGCSRSPGDGSAARPGGSGPAPGADKAQPAAPLVVMAASAEPTTAVPGGSLTLLWTFRTADGWHLYGNVRNDSGFAPRQRLELPPGWAAGPLLWPAPARHVSAGDILDHVHVGELVLLQDVQVPPDARPGRFELAASWEWLACRDSCVPGRDTLAVAVTVADAAPPAAPAGRLEGLRARLPRPLPVGLVTVDLAGDTARIARADGGAGRLVFVPALDCGELADLLHDGAGATLSLRLLPADGRVGPLRGLLVVEGAGAGAYILDVPAVPWTASDTTDTPTGG